MWLSLRRLAVATMLVSLAAAGRSTAQQPPPTTALAYRYVTTLGQTGIPWQRSNAYLNQPWGIVGEADGVWVANSAGRNLVRFGSGSVEDLGRAGDPDALYGQPLRSLGDVAVWVRRDAGGQILERRLWCTDPLGQVVVGLPLLGDGRTGSPIVLGKVDEPGGDAAHFLEPTGVAVSGAGVLFVADSGNHRVQVFSAEGQPLATIGRSGQPGSGPGEFNRPARLALSADGLLVIADSGNHRVVAYDVTDPRRPRLVRQYGSGVKGQGDAEFDTPLGVHVDAQFVYVADSGNNRIQVMGRQDGGYRRTVDGSATDACGAPGEHWVYPSDVTQDASGTVYVAMPRRMVVAACSGPHWQPRPDLSRGSASVPYLTTLALHNAPSSVAIAADGAVVIVEQEGHRLVKRAADGTTQWVVGRAGLPGEGDTAQLQFSGPADAGFLPDGRLVVSDSGNGRLVLLNADGSFSAEWGRGSLARPAGLAVAADGTVLVADPGTGRVRRFDSAGRLGADLGPPGSPLTLHEPMDVALAPDGRVYVSDRAEHVVLVLGPDGRVQGAIGERGVSGSDLGHLKWPVGLAVDAVGRLIVADSGNERVQVFDVSGAYLTSIGGRRGTGTGGLREPRGVAVDALGRLYVADTYNHRIQILELAVDPWRPAAINGFGRRSTATVEALAEFGGQLYAGLRDEAGAAVWALGPGQTWRAVTSGGWGDARNQAVTSLASFSGRLYAGVENVVLTVDPTSGSVAESSSGGSLYRTANGADWELVASGGFRDARQSAIGPLVEFRDELFAATRSIDAASPPQLWRSPSGDAGSWTRVPLENSAGREWSKNGSISALAVYTGSLYVGTCGFDQAQLWAGAPGNWRAVGYLPPGGSARDAVAQLGSAAPCVTDLLEYEGYLYAALGVDPRFRHRVSGNRAAPVELWRCRKCDGSDWDMAAALGFGDRTSSGVLKLASFDEPPFRFLYAFVPSPTDGLDVWRSDDGSDWQPLASGGFGDDNNTEPGMQATATYEGRLYVGTRNAVQGAELWSTAGTRPDVVPTPPGPPATPTPRPSPQPPTGRARFVRTDEWPDVEPAPEDVLSAPVDMAVAADGEVYLLDSRPVRVARLLPDRTWGRPFGGTGTGPDRLTDAAAVAVDDASGRVYVADLGTERLLAYDRSGLYQATVLDSAYVVDVVVRSDGTLWVADRMAGGVRRIAPDGTEVERFGEYAPTGDFGFVTLVAVAEEPGGRLWVADRDGQRLRAYDRSPAGAFVRKRTVDLTAPQFARQGCTGQRLQVIADGLLLAGPCVLKDGDFFDGLPANHRGSDLYGVRLRTVGNRPGQFFALATYDSDRINPYNETYPAVVAYADHGFDIVRGYWLGRWFRMGTAAETALIDPVRIDALPNGELFVVDGQAEDPVDGISPPFVRRFAPDGRVLETLGVRTYPSRSYSLVLEPRLLVSTGEPGRLMGVGELRMGRGTDFEVLAYGQSVRRRYCRAGVCSWGMYFEPIWTTTLVNLNQSRGASDYNYAAAFDFVRKQYVLLQLWADSPSDMAMPARLLLFPVERRGRKTEVPLAGTERQALWTDVDVGPDGQIVVLDSLNDAVQLISGDGRKLASFETPKDAWKVAGGPNGEVFVLTNYGHVVRLGADGSMLSRFVGLPNGIAPHTAATDLAVDAWGQVFTIDNLYDMVLVFEPQGTEDESLQGARCSLAADKWVAPEEILLGETARLELALFGTCGFVEEGADIIIAVNASMGAETHNLRVARQVFAIVDLDVHRVGILSFGTGAKVEQPLTSVRSDIIRALFDLAGVRLTRCGANTEAALRTARDMFNASPSSRRKVVVLIDPGREPPPGSCPWSNQSIAQLARSLAAEGVHIVAVNGPSFAAASEVHSNVRVEPRGQGTGRPAIRRALSRRWPDWTIESGKLVDTFPDNIDYVPGSAQPPAAWDAASRSLSWDVGTVRLGDVARFSLTIRPRAEGLWPTNRQAVADLVDGWGAAQQLVLPVPKIRVYGERPTATPTATATATATATPEPTVPPAPARPLFLPIALRTEPCLPDSRNADVALVIDASVSMTELTPGGSTKLDAARQAARAFLELLKPGRDQASVIQFNASVAVLVPLTEDLAAASAGLDRIVVAAGTRLDLALEAGRAELVGPNRRPDNNPVLILLTDGRPTGTTPDEVRRAGQRCREAGLLVFTIGLGEDVDRELLESIASRPEWCFLAPDANELAAIYRQIAYEIPCRPQWP